MKMIPDNNMNSLDIFEDALDCAILNDEKMNIAIEQIQNGENIQFDENHDDLIDVDLDYSNEAHTADTLDVDADDYIAAERDIMKNPYEEDALDALADD